MSYLTNNKIQLVHIASDIVVVSAMAIYFVKKNKSLVNTINELTKRVEEQNEILQKHEQMLKAILLQKQFAVQQPVYEPPVKMTRKMSVESTKVKKPIPKPISEISEMESEIDEEELDKELSEELAELNDDKKKE